jgi:hypothetical protein
MIVGAVTRDTTIVDTGHVWTHCFTNDATASSEAPSTPTIQAHASSADNFHDILLDMHLVFKFGDILFQSVILVSSGF